MAPGEPLERLLGLRREMPGELQIPVEVMDIWKDRAAERAVAQVDGPPVPRAVVAAPVQDGIRVSYPITRLQLDRDAARQRRPRVCLKTPVLLRRIGAAMAAGDDPQHAVVIERDVP